MVNSKRNPPLLLGSAGLGPWRVGPMLEEEDVEEEDDDDQEEEEEEEEEEEKD